MIKDLNTNTKNTKIKCIKINIMDTKDNTKIQKDIKEPDNQKWSVKTTMEEATIKDNNKVIEVITITVVEDKEDKEVKEVVIEEVIPETQQDKYTDIATLGFILGFIVMMSLDVGLG